MLYGPIALATPAIVGGIVAAVNSESVNDFTERAEARVRRWRASTSSSTGWFLGYVMNSLLWILVKFFDLTDGFRHRATKNGSRIAVGLYVVAAWLTAVYFAAIVVLGLVLTAIIFYVAFKILGASTDTGGRGVAELASSAHEGYSRMRDSRTFKKTGIFSEEETGRTDGEGRIFKKTGIFSEEEIGRVTDDGMILRKTGIFSEEETGRIDEEGRIYKKTGIFSEEETGRIDEDGTRYRKRGIFSEEDVGRHERLE